MNRKRGRQDRVLARVLRGLTRPAVGVRQQGVRQAGDSKHLGDGCEQDPIEQSTLTQVDVGANQPAGVDAGAPAARGTILLKGQ